MGQSLRVLIVEDNPLDAELLERQLGRAGFDAACTRVETEEDFRREIRQEYDVILCDYELPQFGGPRALEILHESGLLIPFILVSGTLGEEKAVAIMKDGATDYLLKDRLARLGPAVLYGMEQYRLRRERQEFLEALGDAEARYRGIFENALDGIFRTDADQHPLAVNPAMARIFGYSSAMELLTEVSRLPVDLFVDESRRVAFTRELKTSGLVSEFEAEARRRDGSAIWVIVRVRAGIDDNGVAFNDGVFSDITARRRAEEDLKASQAQLLQSQKMEVVGLLAGGIAHDFNNLLTVINGTSELALLDLPSDGAIAEAFREIRRAGMRAAALTSQLLAFSRKQLVQRQLMQPNDVVRGMASMLSRMLGESIEVTAVLDTTLGKVLGDPNQLEQIIVNLAVNARDAMPHGGTITVRTRNVVLDDDEARALDAAPGLYATLTVSDTGAGMDAETMARVFEPFFTTKEPGKGTGLGLSTVYGIARQSAGWVKVASAPGEGATFVIGLPVSSTEDVAPKAEASRPARSAGVILLVEDDDAVRAVTTRMLQSGGYRVTALASASEALRLVESGQRFDLVLTDVVMPKIGGLELVDLLRTLQPGMRALFCSGYAHDTLTGENAQANGVHALQKPFTSTELLRTVRDVLGQVV